MPETGLKTFVYSFSVSLFAIFAANGMYWHEHPTKASDIKIPRSNITLFLKNDATNPSVAVVPVKKIALSVLPEIKKELPSEVSEDEIIMADDLNLPEIPLEFSIPSLETAPQEKVSAVKFAENAAPKPKLMRQQAEEVKQPDKIVIPLEAPESKGIGRPKKANAPATAPVVKISVQEDEKPTQNGSSPASLLAANDLTTNTGINKADGDNAFEPSDEIPLLPLERGGDKLLQAQNIVRIASETQTNQVALADKSIPIHSMEKSSSTASTEKTPAQSPHWESMADKKVSTDSPWLVAKADGALKNQKISQEAYYQKDSDDIKNALNPSKVSADGVKLASETVKNLLIPIPEDILNDENLTPQLSYTPKEKSSQEKAKTAEVSTEKNAAPQQTAAIEKPAQPQAEENADSKKNKLLASLDAIFSAKEQSKVEPQPKEEKKSILGSLRKKIQKKSSVGKIMPTEMRLSFQPNRAEISGQTLRWIQAFAAKAAENKNMTIEIRIDGTSAMDLQQKRLNLLHNILTNKGVEYSKINTVFTQREPNSFIIKTITHNNQKGANRNLNKAANGYYIQW